MALTLAGSGVVSGLDVPAPGLVLIRKESFTAATEVPLLNVFSATYKNYKFIVTGGSTGSYVGLQYGISGTFSTASYASSEQYHVGGGASVPTSFAHIWLPDSSGGGCEATVFNPFIAVPTGQISVSNYSAGTIVFGGKHSVATSYTDAKLVASSGVITGDVYVYGYNETVGDAVAYSSPPASPIKAWAKFNVAGAIQASSGVSSVTDVGVGKWTVNLSPAMPDANYVVLITGQDSVGQEVNYRVFSATASDFTIYAVNSGSAAYVDPEYVSVAVIR